MERCQEPNTEAAPAAAPTSDWSPLAHPVFRALWIASAVSYTGFELRNYAAPLLMDDFHAPFHLLEGMKQYTFAASMLPLPLFVLFAGALADRVDPRKLLIVTHVWMMLAAAALGALTIANLMTPWLLLAFLFAIGSGYAMMNPTLLAVLSELVDPSELKSAMALNSINMNVARVLGPAIGGLIIAAVAGREPYYVGKGLAFLTTAVSLIGVVFVLNKWKPEPHVSIPCGESVLASAWKGVHYAFTSPRLLEINARIFLFMVCAGILPTTAAVICKQNAVLKGETGAAYMMVSFGVAALIGVYVMQELIRRFGVEKLVTASTIACGFAILGVAEMTSVYVGCAAMFVAGFAWAMVPTNFNIATQSAVPSWIKGRVMGVYVLVLWGSMALSSLIFGRVADSVGQRSALFAAGVGVLIGSVAIVWLRLVPRHVEAV